MALERVKTGVSGLDALIQGGIPRGHSVLLSGPAGSGKTILGLQFLVEGAKGGEKGVYVSFSQSAEGIVSQANEFGWNMEKFMKQGLIRVVFCDLSQLHFTDFIEALRRETVTTGAKRLVIDSLSDIEVHAEPMVHLDMAKSLRDVSKEAGIAIMPSGELVTRRAVLKIVQNINKLGLTALLISELPETSGYLSRDTVSEFMTDGVILLKQITIGESLNRTLEVRKMRNTDLHGGIYSYSIGKGGIEVVEGDKFVNR